MVMKNDYDIIVIGGGLVGSLSALALASAGLSVLVVDAQMPHRQREAAFDGRAYALSLTSIRMLETLGIWDAVAANAEPIRDIKVSHGSAGEGSSPYFVHFDHREIEEGPFGHLLEDRFLRVALLDAMAADARITLLHQSEVMRVKAGRVTLRGPRGGETCYTARLVIGCDGRGSFVAKSNGITRLGWEYEQSSLVCALAHERPHDGVAYQYFTPAGPLAILPLPGNRSSIVWTEDRMVAAEINARDDAGYLAALRPVFGDFLGELRLEGARYTYPLGLSLASSFIAERVALAGDAAHGIHPLAGQGLNLGVRDAAALAQVVVDAMRRGEDIGAWDVLARYQAWRRFDTSAMAVATDSINKAFSGSNSILRAGRDIAFSAMSNAPALRRAFMREAAGLSGDLPRLLAGQAL